MAFLPEIYFLGVVLVFFILSLREQSVIRDQRVAFILSAVGVLVSALAFDQRCELFSGAYRVDFFSQVFKLILSLGFFLVIYIGQGLRDLDDKLYSEYYMFLSISIVGLMLLVSSVELVTIFVALELSSYSLYIVIPFRNRGTHKDQVEAAIKYIIFGAVATGVMLFGMSYLFGIAHTTYIAELAQKLPDLMGQPIAVLGGLLMLAAFMFKFGLFPFHFWLPDVYEGTSNETAAFVATMPKIAAVALLLRLVAALNGGSYTSLIEVLVVISAISMTYGNLAALVQKDIKRILAYSGIAHAGYVLLGVVSVSTLGYAAATYHIIGYMLMSAACFLVVCKLSQEGKNVTLDDLKGLYKRSPWLAFTLATGVFALAGIPPFMGFTGKFFLLSAAFKKGFLGLVIIAAINTAISIFYYLNMVRLAYAVESPSDMPPLSTDISTKLIGFILIVSIILAGILPTTLVNLASMAAQAVL
ncbi:MAG: NADH-quinone oxidoreductase subunit N [Pseudomonadota bacterium]